MKRFIILTAIFITFINNVSALEEADVCLNINFDARASYVKTKFIQSLPELQNSIYYTQVPRGLIVSIPTNKFFYSNSVRLTENGKHLLDIIAEILNTFNNSCAIESHTDETFQMNSIYKEDWEISIHRANILTEYLIKQGGLTSDRLYPIGYGSIMPFNDKKFTNNRIDFVIFDYTARR